MRLHWIILGLLPLTAQAAPQGVDGPALDAALAGMAREGPAAQGFAQDSITALADLFGMAATVQPVIRYAAAPKPPGGSVSVSSGDMQIALTQLSIAEGTNDLLRVQMAQGDRRDAILLVSGRVTLRELVAAAEDLDGISVQGGAVHLSRPLVVWQGAELALEPGDVLQMEAEGGAFLLSFGSVDFQGATLRGSLPASAGESAYRPFVLVSGAGTLRAEESAFSGLGMAGLGPFSGIVVSSRGLFMSDQPVVMAGNRFDDLGSVALVGLAGAAVVDNDFTAARGPALVMSQTKEGLVAGNVVAGTRGSAGIKVTEAALGLQVTGNLVTGGAANGVQIDRGSSGITLTGNAVYDNAGTGVAAKAAECLTLAGNLILRNGASGLRLTETGATRIADNALVANGSSAIAVASQKQATGLALEGNLLALNRVGLTGLVLTTVSMSDNDLSGQLPRIFDGEFAQYQAAYLTARDQQDLTAFQISGVAQAGPADFATVCRTE